MLVGGASAELVGWQRYALWLVAATLFYNVLEAAVALFAGAHAHSVALVGFGFDSLIECAAAAAMLWRVWVELVGGEPERVASTEHRVHRFIGVTFLLLALYVVVQAAHALWVRHVAEESVAGMLLAAASVVVMPLLAAGKLRAARRIGSAALRSEALETLACSYLSFTLLVGLAANAWLGWWWADPVAALFMVPWLAREGWEGVTCPGPSRHRLGA